MFTTHTHSHAHTTLSTTLHMPLSPHTVSTTITRPIFTCCCLLLSLQPTRPIHFKGCGLHHHARHTHLCANIRNRGATTPLSWTLLPNTALTLSLSLSLSLASPPRGPVHLTLKRSLSTVLPLLSLIAHASSSSPSSFCSG